MNFDSIQSDSISVVEGEFDQLAAMLDQGSEIECATFEIETESGDRFRVESDAGYSNLIITPVDND